jgi:hypothetical protein
MQEVEMNAQVGDRIVVKGVHVGDATRIGVVTALRHADGTPPYEVRWLEDGHSGLIFPGPEAHVERGPHHDDR